MGNFLSGAQARLIFFGGAPRAADLLNSDLRMNAVLFLAKEGAYDHVL